MINFLKRVFGQYGTPARVLTAATTVTQADSGSVMYLDAAAGFAVTLPLPLLGRRYTFIVKTAPSGGAYTLVATSGIVKGEQFTAAAAAGDTGTTDTTITFVAASAVAGDRVELWSDGTSWFAHAFSTLAASVTFT